MEKMKTVKILVTGVGGPTPRSFVRSVKLSPNHAKTIEFIGTDVNPMAYGLYDKTMFSKSYIVPRASHAEYWQAINKVIEENDISAAIILPEEEVLEWAENCSKLNRKILVHLPDAKLAGELVNKHNLHVLLEGLDVIPKYVKLTPHTSYHDVETLLGKEFWVRGTEGSSGLGALKITSKDVLTNWLDLNSAVREFIATEFLPGRNLACKLLYFDSKQVASCCGERVHYIMSKVAPSGITGNTSFGRLLNYPELVKISTTILNKISGKLNTGLNGIFTLDFKEDKNGKPLLTEINVRHVAFTSSMAAAGANLPLLTLQILLNDLPIPEEPTHYSFKEGTIFLRDVDGDPILLNEVDLIKESIT